MNKIYLICLFAFSMFISRAGDNCGAATAITPGGACNTTTVNGGSGAPALVTCTGTITREEWWVFPATAGYTYTVTYTTSSNDNPAIYLYTGTCGSQTQVACMNATAGGNPVTETLTYVAGATGNVYIRMVNLGSGNMDGSLCVAISAPTNDDPNNATALTVGTSCSYTTSNNTGATASTCGTIPAPGCAAYAGGDIWFSAVVPASGALNFDTQAGGVVVDAAMAVYSGTPCGTLSLLACDDDAGTGSMPFISLSGLTVGSTVYVRVWEMGNNLFGTFGICATNPCPTGAPANDDCSASVLLTSSTTCSGTAGTVICATASGTAAGACTGTADDDVWYRFVATYTTHTITINPNFDSYLQLYSGSCGSLTSIGCSDPDALAASGLTVGATYFIRVYSTSAIRPTIGTFTICVTEPTVPACAGAPTVTGSCPSSTVLSWTAPSTVSNTAASSYLLYFGTNNPPTNIINGTDIGNVLTYTPSLNPSTTYYWQIVPKNFVGNAVGCSIQNFTTGAVATPSNDDPCAATSILVGSTCSYTTFSNQCASATTVGAPPAPGCAGYSGSDVWFSITVPSSTVTFDTQSGVMTDGGMAIYRGNCAALTLIECDDDDGAGSMPQITRTDLIPGETIWIRVWENGNNNNGTFGLCVYSSCLSSPTNDLPCSATSITLGTVASGDNTCSAEAGEPAAVPGCWSTGSVNAIWYSFVAPVTGSVKIRTAPGSLAQTQMALYSGACGTGLTLVSCNDNAPNCGSTTMTISEIAHTGLTSGATYYVRVDGNASAVGTFAITVVEGSASYPPSSGQACGTNIAVCNSTISVGNPGYQGVGFTCDDTGGGNCTDGERGSSWYTINISSSGTLTFNIVPNNYNGVNCTGESDYDFVLWKIAGAGATNCAAITSGGGAGSVACNFDAQGVTGLSTNGTATAAGFPTCFDAAYETGIAVVAGEVYALLIENYSGSTAGYSLDLSSVAAGTINYTPPTSVTWSGGANTTAYDNITNWGGCTTPSCTVDAVVSPSSSFQPTVTSAMGTVVVKNLTIDPGGILTLGANDVLKVCGNLSNNGTISAAASSTILFSDDLTHTLNGNLTGGNKLGNITITDIAGGANCTVTANAAVEVGGTFTTTNSTSIFNLNGNNFTLGGDFVNSSAGTTFTGVTGSTFTFNGSSAQTYSPGGALTLNNVTLNHSGSGVSISATGTPNMIVGTSGVLTLTNGKIITPGTQEVRVTNTANAAVTVGNSASFVQGNLRRSLAAGATGIFEFPVGHSTKGYQRATIDFKTPSSGAASALLARFDSWGGGWPLPGAPMFGPECTTVYDQPNLDNGYWSIDVASGTSTGSYDITLYNTNYTNAASGWSVAKSPSGGPSWALNGTCVSSPVSAVVRTGLSGFSKFSTIQASVPLPVELVSFTAVSRGTYNEVKWQTVKEENFNRYELESSSDAFMYAKIYTKQGSGTNTNTLMSYAYDDYAAHIPLTYYRLKLIDNDGSYKYSSVVPVETKFIELNKISVYPNPATNEVTIQLSAVGNKKEIYLSVKDVQGRELISGMFVVSPDKPFITLNTSSLLQGTYIVSCKGEGMDEINSKLIINR